MHIPRIGHRRSQELMWARTEAALAQARAASLQADARRPRARTDDLSPRARKALARARRITRRPDQL